MHVDVIRNHQTMKDGSRREYRSTLLRRSFRDEHGRPRKQTLANLSALPERAVDGLRRLLRGELLVSADAQLAVTRSLPHGDVALCHQAAVKLGFAGLLGPACRQRDLTLALIISRVVRPASKLSTMSWWADSTLGADLGVAGADRDEVYGALDWLYARQTDIEKRLAGRHLTEGGTVMFDLSSSWMEGEKCPLSAFGYSRDHKRGRKQIEYGLLTAPRGIPVAIRVFPGNTSDPQAFPEAITAVRDTFGLKKMIFVGDRGMITTTRIDDLKELDGAAWIGALKSAQIAKLAADDGPLQMSLFDEHNLAEFTHPDFPGERLIACRNPALAEMRAHKRQDLLAATETDLAAIAASVAAGRLKSAGRIGVRVGKIIGKHKMAKHFICDIGEKTFTFRRDEDAITAEARLDGIYVIRSSVTETSMTAADLVTEYKNLAFVERDFRHIKVDDLDLRPVRHYLENRVRAHVFLCMLASYLTWHLREALAELTFTDEHIPARTDPVTPARRGAAARKKDASKRTPTGLPVTGFRDLLAHLATLTRDTIDIDGHRIDKLAAPTDRQTRAFQLIAQPIPLHLTA